MTDAPSASADAKRVILVVVLSAVAVTALASVLSLAHLRAEVRERRDQARRAGLPTTVAELEPPAVPLQEDAAPLYAWAFRLLESAHTPFRRHETDFRDPDAPGHAQALTEVAFVLAQHQRGLDLLHQAAERRWCRFAVDWHAPDPLEIFQPHLYDMRRCARLLAARAVIRAERGRLSQALEDLRVCLRMSAHAAQEPTLGSLYSALTIRRYALEGLRRIIVAHDLDFATCRSLFDELAQPDFEQALVDSLAGDGAITLALFDQIEQQPAKMREWMTEWLHHHCEVLCHYPSRVNAAFYTSPLGRVLVLRDLLGHFDRLETELSLARRPYRDAARDYRRLYDTAARVPPYRIMSHWAAEDSLPAFWRACLLAEQGAVRVALALKAFRARYGRYPDSLEAVAADLAWELPEDPFSGKMFGYRRRGEGFLLYSWGADLDDDGGKNRYRPGYLWAGWYSPVDGDIVWCFR